MATVDEVAAHCGVGTRRIQQLVDAGMPKSGRGEYDLLACSAWYIRYLQTEVERRGPGVKAGADAYRTEKARLIKLQADEKEMEVRQARRQLLPVAKAMALLERTLFRLRARVLNLAGKYAPRLVGITTIAEAQARLEQIADDLMLDLQAVAEDEDDDHDGGADDLESEAEVPVAASA